MISFSIRILPFLLILLACKDINDITAEEIINKSIEVSGFNKNEINITFDFRAYHYEFFRKDFYFTYARTTIKDGIIRKVDFFPIIKIFRRHEIINFPS